tara:strand:+ start:405 stop:686 length:282 start_codon:yes stop_codon:yes gene_type:complete
MAIELKKNGLNKKVSTGFSWKSLLFGVFYPLFRGDTKGASIHFALGLITVGISWFVIPFTYNKRYLKRLIEDGWIPSNENAEKYLKRKLKYSV